MLAARIGDAPATSPTTESALPQVRSVTLESKGHTPSNSIAHATPLALGADADESLRSAQRVRPQFANDELLYCACCRDDLIIV
jgi:hypothetical protein